MPQIWSIAPAALSARGGEQTPPHGEARKVGFTSPTTTHQLGAQGAPDNSQLSTRSVQHLELL